MVAQKKLFLPRWVHEIHPNSWVSVKDLAQGCNVSISTIHHALRSGRLPPHDNYEEIKAELDNHYPGSPCTHSSNTRRRHGRNKQGLKECRWRAQTLIKFFNQQEKTQ